MIYKTLKVLSAFASLGLVVGCGAGEKKKKETYEVCKYGEGNSDNCATAVLEDGTCGPNKIKVESEKPANEYTCVQEL